MINKKTVKTILSYMFSFLLVLSIVLSFFLNLLEGTVLSEEYITSRLFDANYYTNVSKTIQSEFEGYIDQSGFDKTILNNVFTENQITADVNSVMSSIYKGSNYEIDTNIIKQNLNTNIESYIKTNNITLDLKQKENIQEFMGTLAASYAKDIFPKDIISQISANISSLNSIISRIGQFIYLLPFVFILCIILINLSKILSSFKYISVSIFSAGLFLVILNILLINLVQIGKITLFTKSTSDMINMLFNNIFNEINHFCIIFALAGLLLTFISVIIEDKFNLEILGPKGVSSNKWVHRFR
jgi:hypothetical protein